MRAAFRIVSFVFHPLLLPLYGFTLVVITNPDPFRYSAEPFGWLTGQFAMNMVLLPLFTLTLMITLKLVKDFYLSDRKQRVIPLISTMFFYWWSHRVFSSRAEVPEVMSMITLGALIAVVGGFFLTMVMFKISLHALGMGVMIGLALSLVPMGDINVLFVLCLTLIVAGLVGTARLSTGEHSGKEVYSGYAVGALSQLVAFALVY
jgi:hypothetical protein